MSHRDGQNRLVAGPASHLAVQHERVRWATGQAASSRVLLVLIENGGIDLGLPELVSRLVDSVPGASSVISPSTRDLLVEKLRSWLRGATDTLLESAELALNHFSAAQPETYGTVTVLRDSTATFAELRTALFEATRSGKVVDLLVLTHGARDHISTVDGIDARRIRTLRSEYGSPLSIRSVYMMNCVGSSLNQAWLDIGARVSAGSHADNSLPEPTTHFFWTAWRSGQTFESAVTGAYRRTVDAMNAAVRAVVEQISVGGPALAARIDLSTLDVVVASRPEVVGVGSLTVSTDALPPATSGTASGLALVTTVLPPGLARGLSGDGGHSPRTVSPAGRAFVERWELPLLGDRPDAAAELARRIGEVEGFLAAQVPAPLSPAQFDALASFALGIGARAFARSSLLRSVQAGDLAGVPGEMVRWTKVRRGGEVVDSPQLRQRRAAEAELFAGRPTAVPQSREVRTYARQQNVAALTLAEALQVGLAAGAIVQTQVNAFPGGSLTVTYDKQARLLTPEARLRMPGAVRPKNTYTRDLIRFPRLGPGLAEAQLVITWEGNDYGEMSTPVITKDLDRTSEWQRSEASLAITAVSRIPTSTDARTWPLWYHYEGWFDPVGNGEWEVQGDFELNAFGALRFHGHRVVSRSFLDATISVHPDTWKGPDVDAPVPAIPTDQAAFLRENVPA